MIKLILFIFLASAQAFAVEECLEISEKQMADWKDAQPDLPSFSDLVSAKKLIDAERKYSLKLGSDKRAHCYLGCRISSDVNFETAQYAAWQKEYNDATDCSPKTHFEIADYNATVAGAKQAAQKPVQKMTKKLCTEFCKKAY